MRGSRGILAGALLCGWGLILAGFGLYRVTVPQPEFVSGTPEPGSTAADLPAVVGVTFDRALPPGRAQVEVSQTVALGPAGEEYPGRDVVVRSGVDSTDPGGLRLVAELAADVRPGLFNVSWRIHGQRRVVRYGHYYFAVGMPVPAHVTRGWSGPVWERDPEWREQRSALAGGIVLLLLGALLVVRGRAGRVGSSRRPPPRFDRPGPD